MKRNILLSAIFIFSLALSQAVASGNDPESQRDPIVKVTPPAIDTYDYNTAFGVRGIGTSGLTIKHFNTETRAIEGIIGLWPEAFSATILFEKYANAFDTPGLNWYYGAGGHIATQSDWVYYDGARRYERRDGEFGVGVDGILGIEYKINGAPIALSMDVKPFIEITTNGNAYVAIDPGLGFKFTF